MPAFVINGLNRSVFIVEAPFWGKITGKSEVKLAFISCRNVDYNVSQPPISLLELFLHIICIEAM